MVWKPNVTVAAITEKEGEFLFVEEQTSDGIKLNQPAGHLEPKESLVDAVIREVREETAYDFEPKYIVGIYQFDKIGSDVSFLRVTFAGELGCFYDDQDLDKGIIRSVWLAPSCLSSQKYALRSPLVLDSLNDYIQGKRYSLEVIRSQY